MLKNNNEMNKEVIEFEYIYNFDEQIFYPMKLKDILKINADLFKKIKKLLKYKKIKKITFSYSFDLHLKEKIILIDFENIDSRMTLALDKKFKIIKQYYYLLHDTFQHDIPCQGSNGVDVVPVFYIKNNSKGIGYNIVSKNNKNIWMDITEKSIYATKENYDKISKTLNLFDESTLRTYFTNLNGKYELNIPIIESWLKKIKEFNYIKKIMLKD